MTVPIQKITAPELAAVLRSSSSSSSSSAATTITTADPAASSSLPPAPGSTAIIDVRDSDHVGGHIRNSAWIPSAALDAHLPELVRSLAGCERVVFHCSLSQQRGPKAARKYAEERARVRALERRGAGKGEAGVAAEGEEGGEGDGEGKGKEQEVCVLEGGFVAWQEEFGRDEGLTEGYAEDVWKFGYQG